MQWFKITEVTLAPTIDEDKSYLKIYKQTQSHTPNTNNSEHQTQITTTSLPNTIQTVILICKAKGTPNAIARKNCKTKTVKTEVLEIYA